MTAPIRRMRPAAAAARAVEPAPAKTLVPVKRMTEEIGRGTVRTKTSRAGEVYDETERDVEVLRQNFDENRPPCFVRVGAGLTLSLGKFESLRIDVSVSVPCEYAQREDAYEIASDFVAEKVNEEQVRWLPGMPKANGSAKNGRH